MTQFMKKTFSVPLGSDLYRQNYDAIFRQKKEPEEGEEEEETEKAAVKPGRGRR